MIGVDPHSWVCWVDDSPRLTGHLRGLISDYQPNSKNYDRDLGTIASSPLWSGQIETYR